ncbi:MAG: PAS domain S-box protein [Desulfatirhabdiaceae bacterium]
MDYHTSRYGDISDSDNKSGAFDDLYNMAREKAREKVARLPENMKSMSPEEIQKMLHDLQVHQIELEIQNEELRRTQESLTLSRDRFAVLFHQAPIGYLVLDQNGIIREASDMFRQMTNADIKITLSRALVEFIEDSDRDWFLSRFRSFFNHPEGKNLDVRLISAPGSVRFVRITGAKLTMPKSCRFPDHSSQLLVSVSDITGQKQAETELKFALSEALRRDRETQALLAASRAVMECAQFEESSRRIFDTCREITGAVSGYIAMLSHNGMENDVLFLESGNLACTVDPDLPMPIRGLRAEAYATAKVVYNNDFMNSEWVQYMPPGHVVMQNVMFAPLIIDKNVVGVIGLANKPTDFTEEDADIVGAMADMAAVSLRRIRAEEALQERERYLSSILETTQDGFWVLDTNGRIIDVNEAYCLMSGYTRDELLHMHIRDLNVTETPNETIERIERVIRNGFEFFESRHRKKDGTVIDVEVSATWMGGKICRFVSFFRDITERKRTERKLRWLHKANSLGVMAGAISHHFNNQLQVVIGNLEMAMEDMTPGSDNWDAMTEALKAARKTARFIGMMLTYIGQKSGKRDLLDLSDVCRQSLPTLQDALPKDISLDVDLPSSGPIIRADMHQIQQILGNLVSNAGEAIDEGPGCIHVSVKKISPSDIPSTHRFPLDWHPHETEYACLEVSDAGVGINEKNIEKLFDPFYTTRFTGRGLGLSVVLGIVQAHCGAVSVQSEMGRGSTFCIYLPVSAEAVPAHPKNMNSTPLISHGKTILLVEDETAVRNMVRTMLSRMGFRVIEAKDGMDALALYRQHRDEIHCVLCDLTMPRMNGWETLTALRSLSSDIPVILASGYDASDVMPGDHPERPDLFLGKPYRSTELKNALRQVMGG